MTMEKQNIYNGIYSSCGVFWCRRGRRWESEIGGHRYFGRKYYLDLCEYPEDGEVPPKRPTYPADYTIVIE